MVVTQLALLMLIFGGVIGHAKSAITGSHSGPPVISLAEKQIQWAWRYWPDYIKLCLFTNECALTSEQVKLVERIVPNLTRYGPKTLQFLSEVDGPFTSNLGEVERIALTGSAAGSKILINRDRILAKGQSRGLAFWMGILTHEAAHHLGIPDDARRIPDQLGAAIAQSVDRNCLRVGVPEDRPLVFLEILNPPVPNVPSVIKAFPKGALFHIFSHDRERVVDEEVKDELRRVTDVCESDQFVVGRVTPVSSRILAGARPGESRAEVGLNANFTCLNRRTFRVRERTLRLRHFVASFPHKFDFAADLHHLAKQND